MSIRTLVNTNAREALDGPAPDRAPLGFHRRLPGYEETPLVDAPGIDVLAAVDDGPAREAMRMTAASGIVSGETGAAGLGGLLELLRGDGPRQEREEARRVLRANRESRVLLFNYEGATDPDRFREQVGGKPPEREA